MKVSFQIIGLALLSVVTSPIWAQGAFDSEPGTNENDLFGFDFMFGDTPIKDVLPSHAEDIAKKDDSQKSEMEERKDENTLAKILAMQSGDDKDAGFAFNEENENSVVENGGALVGDEEEDLEEIMAMISADKNILDDNNDDDDDDDDNEEESAFPEFLRNALSKIPAFGNAAKVNEDDEKAVEEMIAGMMAENGDTLGDLGNIPVGDEDEKAVEEYEKIVASIMAGEEPTFDAMGNIPVGDEDEKAVEEYEKIVASIMAGEEPTFDAMGNIPVGDEDENALEEYEKIVASVMAGGNNPVMENNPVGGDDDKFGQEFEKILSGMMGGNVGNIPGLSDVDRKSMQGVDTMFSMLNSQNTDGFISDMLPRGKEFISDMLPREKGIVDIEGQGRGPFDLGFGGLGGLLGGGGQRDGPLGGGLFGGGGQRDGPLGGGLLRADQGGLFGRRRGRKGRLSRQNNSEPETKSPSSGRRRMLRKKKQDVPEAPKPRRLANTAGWGFRTTTGGAKRTASLLSEGLGEVMGGVNGGINGVVKNIDFQEVNDAAKKTAGYLLGVAKRNVPGEIVNDLLTTREGNAFETVKAVVAAGSSDPEAIVPIVEDLGSNYFKVMKKVKNEMDSFLTILFS